MHVELFGIWVPGRSSKPTAAKVALSSHSPKYFAALAYGAVGLSLVEPLALRHIMLCWMLSVTTQEAVPDLCVSLQ